MKVLFISGGDYAALQFEQHFKGKSVSDVISDLVKHTDSFIREYPEYEEDFNLDVRELNIDKHSFEVIKNRLCTYDNSKHSNAFLEVSIF